MGVEGNLLSIETMVQDIHNDIDISDQQFLEGQTLADTTPRIWPGNRTITFLTAQWLPSDPEKLIYNSVAPSQVYM